MAAEQQRSGLVALFGSTGALGRCLVRSLVSAGYSVRCVARTPSALDELVKEMPEGKVEVVQADIMAEGGAEAAKEAVRGTSAVVSTLGGSSLMTRLHIVEAGARAITKAMEEEDIARLVQVSSWGVKREADDSSLMSSFVYWLLKYPLEDHRAAEKVITEAPAGLQYTIVRPPGLSNDEPTGSYEGHEGKGSVVSAASRRMARADVAAYIADILEDATTYRKGIAVCAVPVEE